MYNKLKCNETNRRFFSSLVGRADPRAGKLAALFLKITIERIG